MKLSWEADWWGITLVASDEEAKALLVTLRKALPQKSPSPYDHGELEWEEDEEHAKMIFAR